MRSPPALPRRLGVGGHAMAGVVFPSKKPAGPDKDVVAKEVRVHLCTYVRHVARGPC